MKTSLITILLFLTPTTMFAHGGLDDVPTAPDSGSWLRQEPVSGGESFSEKLRLEGRGLVTADQFMLLERALVHYDYAEKIGWGWFHGRVTPDDGDYNRQLGDNALAQVISNLTPTLTLDFRPPALLPDPELAIDYDDATRAVLLKVVVSDGPTSFRHQTFDMEQERYHPPYTVDVAPQGTTWVLMEVTGPPRGLSRLPFAIRKEGEAEPFRWHAMTLDRQPPGGIMLSIQEEDGRPTSALVRITHREKKSLWPIDASHDLGPVIHDIATPPESSPLDLSIIGPGGSIRVRVPGDRAGYYWLCSNKTEVAIPAGDWQVTLLRGIEFQPWEKTVTVRTGEWTAVEAKTVRWIDMRELGWTSGDDHVHAQLMNSNDANSLLGFARAMDIRMANILEMGDPQRTYYNQRGFGESFRTERDGYWLVPGQEDPRSILGHSIALNISELARDVNRYLALDAIAEEVHRQGGVFGQAHVGQNTCFAHRGMAVLVPHQLYNFASIMQGGLGTDLYYDFLNLGYQLTASAGSDMPYAGIMGDVRLYVYTGKESASPDEWFAGIRKGHTFTTNGPMLEFTVEDRLPGETIDSSPEDTVKVRARAWGWPGESAPQSLQVVALGNVLETARSANPVGDELTIELEVPVGDGMWIAARSWGVNDSAAHTTPVYIKVPGKRHWNREKAPEIIARQLAVLDEIEAEIMRVEQRQAAGELIPLDFGNVGIFRERETLRALLNKSRLLYAELQGQLAP